MFRRGVMSRHTVQLMGSTVNLRLGGSQTRRSKPPCSSVRVCDRPIARVLSRICNLPQASSRAAWLASVIQTTAALSKASRCNDVVAVAAKRKHCSDWMRHSSASDMVSCLFAPLCRACARFRTTQCQSTDNARTPHGTAPKSRRPGTSHAVSIRPFGLANSEHGGPGDSLGLCCRGRLFVRRCPKQRLNSRLFVEFEIACAQTRGPTRLPSRCRSSTG
jgi:hypothetical protein